MKYSLVLWLSILLSPCDLRGQCSSYFQCYPKESAAALQFYETQKHITDSIFNSFQIPPAFGFSIVAPEIGHFSVWRNRMETTATELFYVELGEEYADFSIGPLQMKPTFAERVEQEIALLGLNEFSFLTTFNTKNEAVIRKRRVERLNSYRWQLSYLCAFLRIMQHREGLTLNVNDLEEAANAYNAGFWVSPARRVQLKNSKLFPSRFSTQKFAYGKIAREYFGRLAQ
jgi:hypothetical protein